MILLRMDDKMNRQLTCEISEEEKSFSLAEELVLHGFISSVSNIFKYLNLHPLCNETCCFGAVYCYYFLLLFFNNLMCSTFSNIHQIFTKLTFSDVSLSVYPIF